MTNITLKAVDHTDRDLKGLVERLDRELREKYPESGIFGLDFNAPEISEVTFVVAYYNQTPAGCGAIRPISPESMELKRFFVDRLFRRKGIATEIIRFLEDQAGRSGYRSIKLETGPLQPEAICFYTKNGYSEIERFGEYVGSVYSICFEKVL